ncbi:MAG: hypothetical protein ACFFAU_01965 [Candidatus Hodarchaeota archaeon]
MEVKVISYRKDKKNRFKTLEEKLKAIQDSTKKEVQERLKEGIRIHSATSYLPEDLTEYILSLKQNLEMAASLLPDSLFKRPVFFGKEDFYYRLASELISFGLAYQRVNLQPIRLSKLAELFHQHRSWWKCDIQDIEKALDALCEHNIVQYSSNGYVFEPMTLSRDIHDFLAFIAPRINEYGEISLSDIQKYVPWDYPKIEAAINLLNTNKICIFDKNQESIFFPEFRKGTK